MRDPKGTNMVTIDRSEFQRVDGSCVLCDGKGFVPVKGVAARDDGGVGGAFCICAKGRYRVAHVNDDVVEVATP